LKGEEVWKLEILRRKKRKMMSFVKGWVVVFFFFLYANGMGHVWVAMGNFLFLP
jgi:hypothetical protein